MSIGSATRASAAEPWDTWPKKPADDARGAEKSWKLWPQKPAVPSTERKLADDASEAARAGDATGQKGKSYGKIALIALGIAAAVGIAIAAGGGGGGDGGGPVTNPGHH